MIDTQALTALVRLTTRVKAESEALATRAKESMSQSAYIIDSSRRLLSEWPVSGTPSFSQGGSLRPAIQAPAAPRMDRTGTPAANSDATLEKVSEQNFSGDTVRLDGRHFIDCTLEDCTLEYSGGALVLEGTHFTGCRFHFGGEASMTVSILQCFGIIGDDFEASPVSPQRGDNLKRVN